MKAIILAAGRGERLRPLTEHIPKPLAEVQGRPLLGWHLKHLLQAGFKDVVINVCWLKESIKNFVNQHAPATLNIKISDEGNQALETGGGIKKALPLLGEKPFLAISADVFTDFNFNQFSPLSKNIWVHLVLVENPSHNPSGDFAIEKNKLTLKQAGKKSYTYSGIGIFHPDLFTDQNLGTTFKIAPLIKQAIISGQATAQIHHGMWSDVGTLERLDELNRQQ
ncbi:MAG: nucleotidyltransferase family protein [Marinicella sp.]